MNKILFVSSAIVTSIVFGQSAFAETNLQLSQADLIAASHGYILQNSGERPKARRSALFAGILDNKNVGVTTLAKATPKPVPVVAQATTDATTFVYTGGYAADASTFIYTKAQAKPDAAIFVYPGSEG